MDLIVYRSRVEKGVTSVVREVVVAGGRSCSFDSRMGHEFLCYRSIECPSYAELMLDYSGLRSKGVGVRGANEEASVA